MAQLGVFFSSDRLFIENAFLCFTTVCSLIWLFTCDATLLKVGSLHAASYTNFVFLQVKIWPVKLIKDPSSLLLPLSCLCFFVLGPCFVLQYFVSCLVL